MTQYVVYSPVYENYAGELVGDVLKTVRDKQDVKRFETEADAKKVAFALHFVSCTRWYVQKLDDSVESIGQQ
jgi:hypothetical protein